MTSNGKSKLKRGVTLYSYQEEFYTHAMNLEDCLAEVASMGAEGVQLLPEQMAPGYPDIPQSWVDEWFRMLDKYHLKPSCFCTMVDTTVGGHRTMDIKEAAQVLGDQMKLARRLGFSVIRPTTGPVEEGAVAMVMAALPYAEKYDVKLAPEIHAPIRLRSKYIDEYLELIQKTGTKHFGFTLDLGVFCPHTPKIVFDQAIRRGSSPELMRYVDEQIRACGDQMKTGEVVDSKSDFWYDRFIARMAFGFGPPDNDPKDIALIAPYIFNIHGKFYEMSEQMEETTIPYEKVIPALIENNVCSYIDSEYEGQRFLQDMMEIDSCEQVRRHHVMLKRLLGEA